jgi:hypothetical protein
MMTVTIVRIISITRSIVVVICNNNNNHFIYIILVMIIIIRRRMVLFFPWTLQAVAEMLVPDLRPMSRSPEVKNVLRQVIGQDEAEALRQVRWISGGFNEGGK